MHTIPQKEAEKNADSYEQLDLFTMFDEEKKKESEEAKAREEKVLKMQQAVLSIKDRYGKNAVLRGFNYLDGATQRQRNGMIGGHQAENGEV